MGKFSPRFLQNRDISIRMVLLKLETEPGQQLMANCWSKKGDSNNGSQDKEAGMNYWGHRVSPNRTISASTAPFANWKSYPESCWPWATLVAFCLDLDNTHFYIMRFFSAGDTIFRGAGTKRGPWNPLLSVRKKPAWKSSYTDSRMHWRLECV